MKYLQGEESQTIKTNYNHQPGDWKIISYKYKQGGYNQTVALMWPITSKYKCVELILLRATIGDQTNHNTIMLHKLYITHSTSLPATTTNYKQLWLDLRILKLLLGVNILTDIPDLSTTPKYMMLVFLLLDYYYG